MEKETVANGGVGFFGWLALIFIVLKLTKVITWSWWLVTLPLWGPIAIIILIVIIIGTVSLSSK